MLHPQAVDELWDGTVTVFDGQASDGGEGACSKVMQKTSKHAWKNLLLQTGEDFYSHKVIIAKCSFFLCKIIKQPLKECGKDKNTDIVGEG